MNLDEHPFYQLFNSPEAQKSLSLAPILDFESGNVICNEGDHSEDLYLVLKGVLEISKMAEEHSIILAQVKEGEYFGELAIIDGGIRSAKVTSKTPSTLAIVSKSLLMELFESAKFSTFQSMLQKLCSRVRESNNRLVTEMVRREKQSLIGEMASSILHDLKSPLAAVQLASECISMDHPEEKTKSFCTLIQQQIHHMAGMIEEVLEFSKGQQTVRLKPTRLNEIFQQIEFLNQHLLNEKNVQLILSSTPAVIMLDEDKILRVLQNLISNAVAAFKTSGSQIRITHANTNAGHEIRVEDNGPGIPKIIRHNLFEPFVTHGKKTGTGLGLAIVKKIIEAHKGSISFETEEGKGTTFIIRIPA